MCLTALSAAKNRFYFIIGNSFYLIIKINFSKIIYPKSIARLFYNRSAKFYKIQVKRRQTAVITN